jgi:hypothetical protein
MKKVINSVDTLQSFIGEIRQMFNEKRYLEVSIVEQGKKRSNDQNSTQHCWYVQVHRELKEHTAGKVKCFCKFHFGLPILRGDDEHFNNVCVKFIDPLTYEDKIEAMEFFPVTSRMNTRQSNEYSEAMQEHYLKRNVFLKYKNEKA